MTNRLLILLAVVFVVRWTTTEAVAKYPPEGAQWAVVGPQCYCTIEQKDHEERFGDEAHAKAQMSFLGTQGLKSKLFRVTEEPIK